MIIPVIKSVSPLRLDPQRQATLRRRFTADINKKFLSLKHFIRDLVEREDAFGLKEPRYSVLIRLTRFAFETNANKIRQYQRWLQEQVDQGILSTTADGQPWTNEYIGSAYRAGIVRTYGDVKSEIGDSTEFYVGQQSQFLADAFNSPQYTKSIELLYTRAYSQLEGVTRQMEQSMSRVLADGFANGLHASQIARNLNREVDLTRKRALTIARTEMANAYSTAQLDGFERLGITDLGVAVEWQTAQDDDVCPLCADLEGAVFHIDEARGMLPLHPNCRCAWVPAIEIPTKSRR